MTRFRLIYLVAGWAALGLGAAGAVLPLLPTTPFLLAAAWCFCRSSPRMAGWLLSHPVLGKPLRAWQREGAISTPAKLVALASMAIGYGLTIHFAGLDMLPATALAALLLAVATFLLTRPAPSGCQTTQHRGGWSKPGRIPRANVRHGAAIARTGQQHPDLSGGKGR